MRTTVPASIIPRNARDFRIKSKIEIRPLRIIDYYRNRRCSESHELIEDTEARSQRHGLQGTVSKTRRWKRKESYIGSAVDEAKPETARSPTEDLKDSSKSGYKKARLQRRPCASVGHTSAL
jgi:hypothetical protein